MFIKALFTIAKLLLLLSHFHCWTLLCPTLCDPIDGNPPGSPVPGILQTRTLEWVAISFSNAKVKSESEVAQSCPTLSDPMDCSLPGSSVHGILQAKDTSKYLLMDVQRKVWYIRIMEYYSALKIKFWHMLQHR